MFKKYNMQWTGHRGYKKPVDFYINTKNRRKGGFFYRAIVVGELPRLDSEKRDYARYEANSAKLEKSRQCKCEPTLKTGVMEKWPGQECLAKLWKKLINLGFVNMSEIALPCPFLSETEPDHEDIVEADILFGK